MNNDSQSYWEKYYSNHRNPAPPSPFSQFVEPFIQPNKSMIELGCGNGRDSVFFAGKNIEMISIDQCPTEIKFLSETYSSKKNILFQVGDMSELKGITNLDYIYSRFTLHSVNIEKEASILKWAYANLNPSGLFFIEVRSINDTLYGQGTEVGKHEFVTDHYRRFVDLEELDQKSNAIGFNTFYKLESQGLAVYKDEDPAVIRLILQK